MTGIVHGASRLKAAFPADRAALVVYLMAGYPDRATSIAALRAAADAGADVIELGVPFGDALADGPVIAAAGHAARSAPGGFGLADAVDIASEVTATEGFPPLALMTYYNPILRMGLEEAASAAVGAGVSGSIVPDLPPDAAGPWREVSAGYGLGCVFLVAPTSTPERIALATDASTGFVYCVSTTGITGERTDLPPDLAGTVARVREAATLPVAVGFGISSAENASAVARIADGVVVGSAAVRRQGDPAALAIFVRELADAVRTAR